MRVELEQRFWNRWPSWFNRKNMRQSLMCFGFEHQDGWFDLIWKLCEDIEQLVPEGFEVFQVKEKFGGLRFYTSGAPDEVHKRITKAEHESYDICEVCGNAGKLRHFRWWQTLCDEHCKEEAERRGVPIPEGEPVY